MQVLRLMVVLPDRMLWCLLLSSLRVQEKPFLLSSLARDPKAAHLTPWRNVHALRMRSRFFRLHGNLPASVYHVSLNPTV